MITEIELQNVQSHKYTILKLHPKINTIIGTTGSGKSAIIRGLYWARYNQPAGEGLISKWAKNEKGKQIEDTSVVVHKKDKTLKRIKGKENNSYDIGGVLLEALGKGGLPDPVISFFNTTDVSMQRQMDVPFLIGYSAPEIARFLNTIVDMTEIDTYLSVIDSKKRSNTKDIKRLESELDALEKGLTKFSVLPDIETLLSKIEKIQKRKDAKKQDIDVLNTLLVSHASLQGKLVVSNVFERLEVLLLKAKPILTQKKELSKKIDLLQRTLTSYETSQIIVQKGTSIRKLDNLLKKIGTVHAEKKGRSKSHKNLETLIYSYKVNITIVEEATKEIQKLVKQLPEICPTCGQLWRHT